LQNKLKQEITVFPYVFKNWKYFRPADFLPDPRAVIARQMDWNASWDIQPSPWNGMEPDEYTHGICHSKPVDLPFIEDQCFFYVQKFDLWCSMYYIDKDEHANLLNREVIKLQPLAIWNTPKRKHFTKKVKKNLIQREFKRPNSTIGSAAERLFQMGYYSVLQDKYFTGNEEYLFTRVGTARVVADELEFEDEDDFINET
jgi:hypothetical protein